MRSQRDHISEILKELKRIQADPNFPAHQEGIPGLIAAGERGSIIVTEKIEREIGAVARLLLSNDPEAARQYSVSEWRSLVRRAFGPVLGLIDLDDNPSDNIETILQHVGKEIETARLSYARREYSVGCTLFGNTDVSPIIMGSVRIEVRSDWLARNLKAGSVEAITARRVKKYWSNGRSSRKRKKFVDQARERDIIDAVGGCPFVCSIESEGLGPETGRSKALMAARMALAAVALLWERPSSALDGFRLKVDGDIRREKVLAFVPGKITLAGSKLSHLPNGHTFKAGEWDTLAAHFIDHFKITGEILEFVLHPTGNVPRPDLMNTLMQALLWFHEACRETVDVMAIVKFTTALDALACGMKERGIRELLAARVGFKEDMQIYKGGGPTMKEAVKQLYSEGRSRTVHGTNKKLAHDWTELRSLAETLARLCLLHSMHWAAKNPSEDNPDKLRVS